MSRSGYSYDDDGDVPVALYRRSVENAIAGKRGQKFLRDLVEALDAMPEKALITSDLQNEDGDVCAVGALGRRRAIDMEGIDPEDRTRIAKAFGVAECLAREVFFENDENGCGHEYDVNGKWVYRSETPQQRWSRMRKWAAELIVSTESRK